MNAIADALRESAALYAAAQVAHTLGFIVLVGAVFFFDLRVLGLARTLSIAALTRAGKVHRRGQCFGEAAR